jgi:hypothetical protein
LLAASALLAVAWLATPHRSTPPLYDGVAFPDEPYRYITAPPGAPATPPAGTATADAHFFAGTSQPTYGGSNEQGPQVQVVADEGDISAPSGATVVHLLASPTAPTGPPPDATIWGNVYRLTATSDTGPAQIHTGGSTSTTAIILRAPVGPTPEPVMEYTDGTTWRRLPVTRVGNDIYSSPIAGVGDYALATLPGQPQPVPGTAHATGGPGIDRWILIPGIALLVLIATIAAIRWTRTTHRRATADMIDTTALLTYARMVAATAATMNLPPDRQATLQATADQLLQAASTPQSDSRQLHRLADDLLATLRTAAPTLASRTAIILGEQAVRKLSR